MDLSVDDISCAMLCSKRLYSSSPRTQDHRIPAAAGYKMLQKIPSLVK